MNSESRSMRQLKEKTAQKVSKFVGKIISNFTKKLRAQFNQKRLITLIRYTLNSCMILIFEMAQTIPFFIF